MTVELDVRLPLDRFELRVEARLDSPATAIFGPSGAGKTSLLEILAGLRRGARGIVRVDGETWLDRPFDGGPGNAGRSLSLPPERRAVGWVPQEGLLFPHLDVRGNRLAGARARADGEIAHVAALLELEPLLDRHPATLSGGERQRVALGRALCSRPRLLLLDEPLAALDLPLRRRLLAFLRRVRRELTVPLVLISHDPVEVQALCDEVLVLREGRIAARGAPERILRDPALVEQGRVENVVVGRLAGHDDATSRIALGTGPAAPELITLRADAAPGDEVLVGLAAADILLAAEPPRGLSARNVLAAKVVEIRRAGGAAWVDAELTGARQPDGARLTIEVTETTPERLGVEVGGSVHLVIKASSARVWTSGSPGDQLAVSNSQSSTNKSGMD